MVAITTERMYQTLKKRDKLPTVSTGYIPGFQNQLRMYSIALHQEPQQVHTHSYMIIQHK